jgi:16S rRNA (guanine966-N2)-methyltransferase
MRVIGGEFRSRRLRGIPGEATRPTPDRLRETLFDILQTRIEGSTFVDAYAGTGAVGIEAISRGAAHAYFFEKNRVALDAIRENLATLGIEARSTVVAGSVARTLALWKADIVFVDPPYALDREYAAVFAAFGANPPPLAIVQHSVHFGLPAAPGLEHTRDVRQGDNVLSFYVPAAALNPPAPPALPACS